MKKPHIKRVKYDNSGYMWQALYSNGEFIVGDLHFVIRQVRERYILSMGLYTNADYRLLYSRHMATSVSS